MKTLEIAPLKEKKLSTIIVEKEYNEPFWMLEPIPNGQSRMLQALSQSSTSFYKFLENLLSEVKPDLVTEELGMRSENDFHQNNILAELFKKKGIPFFAVDIYANARNYLAANLNKKKEQLTNVLKALDAMSSRKNQDPLEKGYLIAYGQCLQLELEEQEREAAFPVREDWIAMGIMDHARELESKNEITCLHLSSPEHASGIEKLLESLDVRVETIRLSRKVISAQVVGSRPDDSADLLQSMQIQIRPILKKSSENSPFLLFYLDTDEKASPFDICIAYDIGYDAVIPYENVKPEDAKRIAQDALFSRGPKAVKHTCFFIGGKDAEKAEEVFKAVKGTMFQPFKSSIIVDPGGAYTTAAAVVAKMEKGLESNKLGQLKDKTCAVFGTGSVGQIAAILLAKLGSDVIIASINPERKDGKEHVEKVARLLAKEHGAKVKGVFAPTRADKLDLAQKADVILCAGTRGIRIIDKELFNELKLMKVIVDINAVPPLGVEGLELKDDMKEIAPGIFGIGALAVGDVKYRLEREILREARLEKEEIYNYNSALLLARKILQKEISLSKLALTLSYKPSKRNQAVIL
jgi:methylene-tetrahydromethanopterin dehydrogenase